jgi:hypothetical protein
MSNPGSIIVGNLKYRVGEQFLLKLDQDDRELEVFPLLELGFGVGYDGSNNVYSLEVSRNGFKEFIIRDTDIDKGNLTEFWTTLDQKVSFLTQNPELRK